MTAVPQTSSQPPGQILAGMLAGAWLAQAISAAARFRIADLLRDGPRLPEELAVAIGMQPGPLQRLLRALAGSGIFAEDADGRFVLTPLSEPLRSDGPTSLRAYAEMMGAPWVWQSFGAIEHSLRTGEPAFDHLFGAPVFEFYQSNPDAARTSIEGLASVGRTQDAAILAAYRFADAAKIVDVGGGRGDLLRAILSSAPTIGGLLLDLPHVVAVARSAFAEAGLEARVDLVGGDFFVEVPGSGDLYLLRKVIHDWDDDRAGAILRRCHAVMPSKARLLLIETVIPEGNAYSYAKLLDLLMLVYAGGRERTLTEHRALLAASGFVLQRVIPTTSAVSILEAISIEHDGEYPGQLMV